MVPQCEAGAQVKSIKTRMLNHDYNITLVKHELYGTVQIDHQEIGK